MKNDELRDGSPPGDDAERDAWLREALRHAPDAAAAPPAALREAILAQARAATASRAPGRVAASRPPRESSFAAFWAWLARPPVASGFAGLMAATLVGLMWWDQPMDLARPRPASPAPGLEKATDADSRRATRSDTAQAFPSADSKAAAKAAGAREDRSAKKDTPDTRATTLSRAPSAPPAPAAGPGSEMRSPRPASVAAAPVTPVTPEPSATAAAPLQAAPPRDRQRMTASGEARRKTEADAFATAPQLAAEDAAKGRETSDADRRELAEPARPLAMRDAARPLGALLAALAAEPSRWSRRLADGTNAPLDDATRRWLGDVDTAASGRWVATIAGAGASAAATAPTMDGPILELWLDGRPAARVGIGGSAVVYDSPRDGAARRWRAPLSETDTARLAATLPR